MLSPLTLAGRVKFLAKPNNNGTLINGWMMRE